MTQGLLRGALGYDWAALFEGSMNADLSDELLGQDTSEASRYTVESGAECLRIPFGGWPKGRNAKAFRSTLLR